VGSEISARKKGTTYPLGTGGSPRSRPPTHARCHAYATRPPTRDATAPAGQQRSQSCPLASLVPRACILCREMVTALERTLDGPLSPGDGEVWTGLGSLNARLLAISWEGPYLRNLESPYRKP